MQFAQPQSPPDEGETSHLRMLNLRSCTQLTDKIGAILGKHGTRIEELSLSACPKLTDKGILCIVRWTGPLAKFNRLRRLCTTGCYKLSDSVYR